MFRNRALLLDRDGVINIDHGFVGTVERFEFTPGLFPFLRTVRDRGYLLAILTNQSGVGRGKFTERDYKRLTAHMLDDMRREKIEIDLTLACFEHPDAQNSEQARDSFWRKPNPGMVLEAIRRLRIDPRRSAFLGDSERDMQAGLAAGIGACLWLTQQPVALPGLIKVMHFEEALARL